VEVVEMAETAGQSWKGHSSDIAVPLLGAEFWKVGTVVSGVLEGRRDQKVGGMAYRLTLDTPVSLDGEEVTEVELPSLTGIKNALESIRLQGYQLKRGDLWRVECEGIKKAKKEGFSDSPEFEIGVIRK
jgi:hypothetical protein